MKLRKEIRKHHLNKIVNKQTLAVNKNFLPKKMFLFRKSSKTDKTTAKEASVYSDVASTLGFMFSFFAIIRMTPVILHRLGY